MQAILLLVTVANRLIANGNEKKTVSQ